MKVRAIELVGERGIVRVEADGTPGWLTVSSDRIRSVSYTIRSNYDEERLARDVCRIVCNESPERSEVLATIQILKPLIW